MRKLLLLILIAVLATASCKKEPGKAPEDPAGKLAPDNFTYATTKTVNISIRLLTNDDQPIAGVLVNVTEPNKKDSTTSLFKAISNAGGYITGSVTVPSYLDTIVISPNYIGLQNNVRALIKSASMTAVIGGKTGFSGDIVAVTSGITKTMFGRYAKISTTLDGTDYVYPNGGDDQTAVFQPLGKPKYLEAVQDNISASLLHFINSSVPEGSSVPSKHPEYLSASAVSTLNITKTSDVYVTYVYEGASYKNTIAYYYYPTNNPPTKRKDIKKVFWVFPNASETNAGGALTSGDKVKLKGDQNDGKFSAGMSVGFMIVQNGWVQSGSNTYTVDPSKQKFYANSNLNPESNSSLTKHSVLLYSPDHNVYVVGFEDLNRETPSANEGKLTADNDYNDLVVYATVATPGAISNSGISTIDKGLDTDGDGLTFGDGFPNDPKRAYSLATAVNTVAFEDKWPEKGDYDMNDLVVNYSYQYSLNVQNQVVDVTGTYTPTAVGASFANGFGVQFPFLASKVKTVTGQKALGNFIQKVASGVEAGQTKAVIIPFDNSKALLSNPDGSYFVNTNPTKEKVSVASAVVYIEFNNALEQSEVGISPYNPFLIINGVRGKEVHLPGYSATDRADKSLFKTFDDTSDPSKNRYYQSADNAPWAINIATPFVYPKEESNISSAYPHFLEWAASGGSLYNDWYSNSGSGYRNNQYIYSR